MEANRLKQPMLKPVHERTPEQNLSRARPLPKRASLRLSTGRLPKGYKFYYSLARELYAAKTEWSSTGFGKIEIIKFEKNQATVYGRAMMWETTKAIEIVDVEKESDEKGEEIFRIALNEAIRIATRKRKDILIKASNNKLTRYYKKFGFVFGDPNKPLQGILSLAN